MKEVECVTRTEMNKQSVTSITKGSVLLLNTVTIVDNNVDTWIECINDDGDTVRLIPDMTGWQDRRKEVMVMNCTTGENAKLFFRQDDHGDYWTHDATRDEYIESVMHKLPWAVMNWAAEKAK